MKETLEIDYDHYGHMRLLKICPNMFINENFMNLKIMLKAVMLFGLSFRLKLRNQIKNR